MTCTPDGASLVGAMTESDIVVLSVEALRQELRKAARAGRLVCYGEIASLLGMDVRSPQRRGKLARLLKEVCALEVGEGRPMLGSLVVRKDTGMPGAGFFRGAADLGVFSGESGDDKRSFWTAEVRRVHEYWGSR